MKHLFAEIKRRISPFTFILLPMALTFTELFGFAFLSPDRKLWPLLFGALWAALLGGIIWLLPRLAARIVFGIVYFLGVIYAGFQTGYYILFGEMMWLSDFGYASEGSDYIGVLLTYPLGWWLGLIALIAVGALLLWKFPHWERKKGNMIAAAAITGIAIVCAVEMPELEFYFDYKELKNGSYADTLAGGDYGRMQSAEAAYENMFNVHRLYRVCGLTQTLCKDFYTHYVYPLTPAYAATQREAAKQLDGYFAERNHTSENEMTGALAGKNVILVLMESMDDWLIGEHTPTICKLMNEGINFTQFYTPLYGAIRTFNTEFCTNTGTFLSSDGGKAFDYVNNTYAQSFANQMRNVGYSAEVFHYNDPAFYSRGVYSLAMGYEKYVCYEDYFTPEEWEQAQYDDTVLFTNEALADEFFREGSTFNFIITRSAHLSYTYNEVLSWWGLKKYPEYYHMTDDERTDCALLKAKLVDDMFAALLESLEERGQLENTVIIGVTDHYTYGYTSGGVVDTQALLALSNVEQSLLLEKTPCFIWSADLQAQEVDTTMSTIDFLPTVLNLLGIESRYDYLGRDVFDPDADEVALFSDGSWICGNLAYDASDAQLFTLDGSDPCEDEHYSLAQAGYYDQLVGAFIKRNNLILQADYYKGK